MNTVQDWGNNPPQKNGLKMHRVLPELDRDNKGFWIGGADGSLRIMKCKDCKHFIHPPAPVCPECYSRLVEYKAISGLATVATFTINYQKWRPDLEVPYNIAIVELDEDPRIRLTTNLVNCSIDEIEIGMRVRVTFEQHEEIYIPLFEPIIEADR